MNLPKKSWKLLKIIKNTDQIKSFSLSHHPEPIYCFRTRTSVKFSFPIDFSGFRNLNRFWYYFQKLALKALLLIFTEIS
jgi:hypothetical protein